jgi:hypothetical protein
MNIEWREWGGATGLTRLTAAPMNHQIRHVP